MMWAIEQPLTPQSRSPEPTPLGGAVRLDRHAPLPSVTTSEPQICCYPGGNTDESSQDDHCYGFGCVDGRL